MQLRRKIATGLYGVTALISVVLGGIYLFRDRFMPYHAVALGSDWPNLRMSEQILIKALMNVAGAGWVTLGVAVVVLLAIPFRREERWSRLLIPVLFLLFYVPNLLATLSVLYNTSATPPWYGNAMALAAVVVGLATDQPWRRRSGS